MKQQVSIYGACPNCGVGWGYVTDGGERYSHVIGIYSRELDVTVAWRCPNCDREWARNELDCSEPT